MVTIAYMAEMDLWITYMVRGGNDLLNGGLGDNDYMYGGREADTYQFGRGYGRDIGQLIVTIHIMGRKLTPFNY